MEKLKLGTVVYLDGIRWHQGMIGGYTKDDFGDDAYLLSSCVIDGQLELNDNGDDDGYICPMDICQEASEIDTQNYFKKLMNK